MHNYCQIITDNNQNKYLIFNQTIATNLKLIQQQFVEYFNDHYIQITNKSKITKTDHIPTFSTMLTNNFIPVFFDNNSQEDFTIYIYTANNKAIRSFAKKKVLS